MLRLNLNSDMTLFSESRQKQILQVAFLLIVAMIVFVTGVSRLSLIDPDEGRYALISKNMIDRHNYLDPWLGNTYYYDKPPLYFWMTAASFKIFGMENIHFSARIVPIVGGILTLLGTYLVSAALFNHALGMISIGTLMSTLAMVGLARFVRMDIYLIAFMTLTFWAFLKGYRQQGPTKWFLLMYPFIGLGILIKGPIALAIPAIVITIFLIWQGLLGQGEWKVLGHMKLILGIAIIIVIAGPWYIYMERAHPGYAREFFLNQNLSRAFNAGNTLGHHNSPLVNPLVLCVGFLPWTGLMLLGLIRYFRSALGRKSIDWESRFLLIWFFFILIFFSISKTILLHYVLPAMIPGAILLSRFLYDYWQSDFPRRRRQLTFAWGYPMVLLAAGTVVLFYLVSALGAAWLQFHEKWQYLPDFYSDTWWSHWGWMISLIYRSLIAVVLIKLFWYLWRNWQLPQLVLTIAGSFLFLIVDLTCTDLPKVTDLYSCQRLAPVIKQYADPETVILVGPVTKNQRWSLDFYLGAGFTVQQIQNLSVLWEYYKNPQQIIYLATDTDPQNQVKWFLGDRVRLLAEYRKTGVLLIPPENKLSSRLTTSR
jgi:4-amino-4-deoxy-L-arabinose transferase-like glycosyltransferase